MMRFAESLAAAERWLLPGACLACGDVAGGPTDPLICSLCQSRWRRLPEPQCVRCGQPLIGDGGPCRFCAGWAESLASARSAVWLDDGARRAVHALKYGGWWRVAEPLALAMRGLVTDRDAVLVPVPLSPRRARKRGYNQAERLARALGGITGVRVQPETLIRTRHTSTQTALSPEERRANIAGAFSARPLGGRRAILVDDVLTTGATLCEAARALAEAGAGSVEAITFARAKPPLG